MNTKRTKKASATLLVYVARRRSRMATCWLDLRRGAPGLDGPFLLEDHVPYGRLPPNSRIFMVVRGERAVLARGKQIHLFPVESSVVVVDCALHLQQTMQKVKAGPQASGVTQHLIQSDPLAAPTDIAHRFYSLILAPLCTGVVFLEHEFNSVSDIIRIIVGWIRGRMGQAVQYRPSVIIMAKQHDSRLPNDLDSRMTIEVLASCNPARELTAGAAEALWRGSFSCLVPLNATRVSDRFHGSSSWRRITTIAGTTSCPSTGPSISSLLQRGCKHFAQAPIRILNVLHAARTFPCPEQLPGQIEILYSCITADAKFLAPASLLTALTLAVDCYEAGMAGMSS